MKRWAPVLFVGASFVSAAGAASAETPDEAKARFAKAHEECLATHRGDPRAESECATTAADHEKNHRAHDAANQKSVADTKTLFGAHLDGAALKAAIDLEKALGKPLDHTLTVAAAKQVPGDTLKQEFRAKIKDAATALEAKAHPLLDAHAKEITDELAKWGKAEQEKIKAKMERYKDTLEKLSGAEKLTQAQIDHKMLVEKAGLARLYEHDLTRELDRAFHKYDTSLDAEIRTKADEIYAAEKAVWQPKAEAGVAAQTKVNMADLAIVRDKLWDRAASARHFSRTTVYALLRGAVFHTLEADIRKQAAA